MESKDCGQDKRIPSTVGTESTNASGLIGLFRKNLKLPRWTELTRNPRINHADGCTRHVTYQFCCNYGYK